MLTIRDVLYTIAYLQEDLTQMKTDATEMIDAPSTELLQDEIALVVSIEESISKILKNIDTLSTKLMDRTDNNSGEKVSVDDDEMIYPQVFIYAYKNYLVIEPASKYLENMPDLEKTDNGYILNETGDNLAISKEALALLHKLKSEGESGEIYTRAVVGESSGIFGWTGGLFTIKNTDKIKMDSESITIPAHSEVENEISDEIIAIIDEKITNKNS